MVRRLTMPPGRRRRRSAAALALVLAVIAIHGCVASRIAGLMADFGASATMPPRIEVVYVREMELSVPPAVAPAPPPPRRRVKRVRAAREPVAAPTPASAASQPPDIPPTEVAEVAEAASAPLPEAAAASVPPAASAPAEAAQAVAAAASAASAPSFAWPGSTRLSYVLTGNYRGEIHGIAQVEWVRVDLRYQVNLDITVGLGFAKLLSRRMSSEGQLTPEGLYPQRYDEDTRVAFRDPRRATMLFEPDAIVMPNGQRRERWPGVQDTASQFVQLTYLFTLHPELLTPGGMVEVPLALPRSVDRWVYDVLGLDTLDTPFGAVDAFHLKPRRVARPGSDLTAEIWFAPALRYLPARIRIQQDAETYIDLMIKRRPQLAAP